MIDLALLVQIGSGLGGDKVSYPFPSFRSHVHSW